MAVNRVRVSSHVNYPVVVRVSHNVAQKTAEKTAERVQKHARRFAPVKTGYLRENILIFRGMDTGFVVRYTVIPMASYSIYQEWGTGPIYPVRAKALRWEDHGVVVFAAHTRGVPAVHYMAKAAAAIKLSQVIYDLHL